MAVATRARAALLLLAPPTMLMVTACATQNTQTASGSSAPALSATPAPPTAPACADLKVAVAAGGVAAGAWSALITFTNSGATTCSITGWAAVVAVTPTGATAASHDAGLMNGLAVAGSPTAVLRSGDRAGVLISGGSKPAAGSDCPPPYEKLMVTPPGASTPVTIPAYLPGLGANAPSCTPIRVSPVHPIDDFSFGRR